MPRALSLVPSLTLLAALAGPATAQTDYSAQIAATGLAGTLTTLDAIAAPDATDRFAIGGLRFLSAIEIALQTRYRVGMSDDFMLFDLPILRLPIAENPNPATFDPAAIETLFQSMSDNLALATDALGGITDTDDVGLIINTADLWFDINANATRDPGEDFTDVTGLVLNGGFGDPPPALTIRFDTSDAAWLSAYAHLLSGFSQAVLSLSPTQSITRVFDARDTMAALSTPTQDFYGLTSYADTVDAAAILLGAVQQQPDPAHSSAARDHFLAMIADNRTFWQRVARETDNDREWIPNKRQVSVLPMAFPADTGPRWLRVLDDAEALLNGELLIPFWRLGPDAGLNLAALLDNPPLLDIPGLIQGWALTPYMEQGRLIDGTNLQMFEQLVSGNAGLYMVVLN